MKTIAAAITFTIIATTAQASGCWQLVSTSSGQVYANCLPSLAMCQRRQSVSMASTCVFVQK